MCTLAARREGVATCPGRLPDHGDSLWKCVFLLVFLFSVSSHCSGLSNTESGSTEIFSFFSGQLYSFGNFVCTEREHMRGKQAGKKEKKV